ncbi:hypothetical protein KFE25_000964 [Diacronema lutheri]|uniref:Uncharacterized protein n=1 Tax=Diacronema lutheri TaxID=2081491 RepID=A0A8J6C9P1_DIALT|nr:hypothetical protein KFE25_000964 [Diacronema lutheri]
MSFRARGREPYVWEDLVTGRRHVVNGDNGDHVLCDRFGEMLPVWRVGVSGVADTKTRMHDFKTKGDVLDESLRRGPEPVRPGKLADEIRDERVQTKGRYRARPVTEPELRMREARLQKALNAEQSNTERAADAKFRQKVEEAHRNYRALEKQLGPKAGGLGGFKAQPPRRVTRADLEPFMALKEDEVIPVAGRMDPFGHFRP